MARAGQRKTHCYMGHELSGDNVRVRLVWSKGKQYEERGCKACKRINEVNRYYRNKKKQKNETYYKCYT